MKRVSKSVLLIALFIGFAIPVWSQAAPSTEGTDFWVTFLRAQKDGDAQLILTISAQEACEVVIENPNTGFTERRNVPVGSTQITISNKNACYSNTNETATKTALHVTATKMISLFAANYITKTFDAANVLPTAALQDDYIIQTYPPSDHDGDNASRGTHFGIIAVEDGETVVDYVLTAKTKSGKTGAQTATLKKGEVWYVATGDGTAGKAADLSGTTVKARDGKKIAVFQGAPHTNIPYQVRDRDHLFSQAMPTAYWGTEFGITASRNHRRDIIAVMAIYDGTEVYITAADGGKRLVKTFDFSSEEDKKHYWTFEIGEYEAYCTDNRNDLYGQLDPPLVTDSSCFLTTSCPAGVHLFMTSNRYDNVTLDTASLGDPAMLWISPIEQVIKEINFSTYDKGTTLHFMNIVTDSANVKSMVWEENRVSKSLANEFHPILGTPEYMYARVKINAGNHHLKGTNGFLAHVYGFGERESYAYSCGSSTVARGVSFNGTPLLVDTLNEEHFCVGTELNMKLNVGSNDFQSVFWDFGDGITYSPDALATDEEKSSAKHTYNTPGWYDLVITINYADQQRCRGMQHEQTETIKISFFVVAPEIINRVEWTCLEEDYVGPAEWSETKEYGCDSIVTVKHLALKKSSYEYSETAQDVAVINGTEYTTSQDVIWKHPGGNEQGCDSTITCHLTITKCLNLEITNDSIGQIVCSGDKYELPYSYDADGRHGKAYLVLNGEETELFLGGEEKIDGRMVGKVTLPVNSWAPGTYIAQLRIEDINCDTVATSDELQLTISYPKTIFDIKFNDILAVKTPDHNGGYDFTGYTFQWYIDGQKIEGATNAVYYSDVPFEEGQTFSVDVIAPDGKVLSACPQEYEEEFFQPEPTQVPARKVIQNKQLYILRDGMMYDIYGQKK